MLKYLASLPADSRMAIPCSATGALSPLSEETLRSALGPESAADLMAALGREAREGAMREGSVLYLKNTLFVAGRDSQGGMSVALLHKALCHRLPGVSVCFVGDWTEGIPFGELNALLFQYFAGHTVSVQAFLSKVLSMSRLVSPRPNLRMDAKGFFEFFSAIPAVGFCKTSVMPLPHRRDALAWVRPLFRNEEDGVVTYLSVEKVLDEDSPEEALISIFRREGLDVSLVNDYPSKDFPEDNPRDRILAALAKIQKKG